MVRDGRLAGEVAVVTGSTSGLGRTIAIMFAAEGARVVVTGRDQARGDDVAASIARDGGIGVFVPADLVDESACVALFDRAEAEFGPVTVLVNNAVVTGGGDGPVANVGREAWEAVLRVDIVAVASLCRLAIPSMLRAGHGSIVNISSRVAERGTPGLSAYTAAKGAMNALTRSITADYARQGIRCNTVQPGYILHDVRDADASEERLARYAAMHLTRVPRAEDVAHAVVFLASREAECITGVTLPVDGGSTAARGLTLG